MNRIEKKPIAGITLGIAGLAICVWMILNVAPENIWTEAGVMTLLFFSFLMTVSWILGSGRWGLIVTCGVFGLLLLSRLGLIDALTIAALMILLILLYLKKTE